MKIIITITMCLSAFMMCLWFIASFPFEKRNPNDINGDGKVTITDVTEYRIESQQRLEEIRKEVLEID